MHGLKLIVLIEKPTSIGPEAPLIELVRQEELDKWNM